MEASFAEAYPKEAVPPPRALRVIKRKGRTPPALQRTYMYYNCGFRNINYRKGEIQEKSDTGKEKEQYKKKGNAGKERAI